MIPTVSVTKNHLQNCDTYAALQQTDRKLYIAVHTERMLLPDCSSTVSSPELRGCSRSVPDKAGCTSPPAMSLCASSHLLLAFLASSCQSTCSIEPKHSTAAYHSTFNHSRKQQILRLQQRMACSTRMAHCLVCCVVLPQAPKDGSELI